MQQEQEEAMRIQNMRGKALFTVVIIVLGIILHHSGLNEARGQEELMYTAIYHENGVLELVRP